MVTVPENGWSGQRRAVRDDQGLPGTSPPVAGALVVAVLREQYQRRDPFLPRPSGDEGDSRDGLMPGAGADGMGLVLLMLSYAPSGRGSLKPGGRKPASGGGGEEQASRDAVDEPAITGIERLMVIAPPGAGSDPGITRLVTQQAAEPEKQLKEEAGEALTAYIADKITAPGWTVISEHWPVNPGGCTAVENAVGDIQDEIHELILGKPAELIARHLQMPEPVSVVLEQVAADAPLPGDQSLQAIVRGAEVIAVVAAAAAGQYHLAWRLPEAASS